MSISQHPPGNAVHHLLVPHHQLAERLSASVETVGDQFVVGTVHGDGCSLWVVTPIIRTQHPRESLHLGHQSLSSSPYAIGFRSRRWLPWKRPSYSTVRWLCS